MDDLLAFLDSIRPLSMPLIEQISRIFNQRVYHKGEMLHRDSDNHDKVVFIISGIIRCYKLESSVEISKCFLQPGHLLITGFTSGNPFLQSGSAHALSESKVLICPKREFDRLYVAFPEFEHHGRVLLQQYLMLSNAILDGIRMQSARQRYLFLQKQFPNLVNFVPDKYLASYLGMSHITLSRIRSNF